MESTPSKNIVSTVLSYFSSPEKGGQSNAMNKGGVTIDNKMHTGLGTNQCQKNGRQDMKYNSKTQELESAHKMDGDWSRQDSSLYSPSSQMVWDMTRNCYEDLPVQQSPVYPPPTPQLYDCPEFMSPTQDLTLAPTALPLVDFFGNFFMDFVDNMYTNSLVQYVCEQTRPSPHRLAAETLARSNLNPNAKEFNPAVRDEAKLVDAEDNSSDEATSSADVMEEGNLGGEAEDVANKPGAPSENSECDIKVVIEDLIEEDDESDDESDDWWDSDEEPCSPSQEIDPSEFEDLFPCPLLMSTLATRSERPANQRTIPCFLLTHITVECAPHPANSRQGLSITSAKRSPAMVRFNDAVEVIEEPEELAVDLAEARVSDFEKRQADRERMERLLAPIFTHKHRCKTFKKLYGNDM